MNFEIFFQVPVCLRLWSLLLEMKGFHSGKETERLGKTVEYSIAGKNGPPQKLSSACIFACTCDHKGCSIIDWTRSSRFELLLAE